MHQIFLLKNEVVIVLNEGFQKWTDLDTYVDGISTFTLDADVL